MQKGYSFFFVYMFRLLARKRTVKLKIFLISTIVSNETSSAENGNTQAPGSTNKFFALNKFIPFSMKRL